MLGERLQLTSRKSIQLGCLSGGGCCGNGSGRADPRAAGGGPAAATADGVAIGIAGGSTDAWASVFHSMVIALRCVACEDAGTIDIVL